MSLSDLKDRVVGPTRGDKVIGALDLLSEWSAEGRTVQARDGREYAASLEHESLREVLADEVAYGHQQVANALVNLGFDVDRRQVHNYREKLRLGKVTL